MRCTICKREADEVPLFEGIHNAEMVHICSTCAETEGVPIIAKPSEQQLEKADERFSVRERMERMSGRRDSTEISKDQIVTQGNLARLRAPAPKEQHEEVLDNYYWTLNIARRRKKLSITQLAGLTQIEPKIIQSIEKGQIPENFQEIFLKLESFLGIKLLKKHSQKINFIRTRDEEQEILKNVRNKMITTEVTDDDELFQEIKNKKIKLERISKGEIDFSKRDDLEEITIDDLVKMKRNKEQSTSQRRKRIETEAMVGDDLDLDLDEL